MTEKIIDPETHPLWIIRLHLHIRAAGPNEAMEAAHVLADAVSDGTENLDETVALDYCTIDNLNEIQEGTTDA